MTLYLQEIYLPADPALIGDTNAAVTNAAGETLDAVDGVSTCAVFVRADQDIVARPCGDNLPVICRENFRIRECW